MPSSNDSNETPARSSSGNTPASSPPPGDNEQINGDVISESMQREEQAMARKRKAQQAKRDKEMEARRKEDLKGGEKGMNSKFKALEYLLNQSKLWSNLMLAEMRKEDEEAEKADEKDRKQAAKREDQAEEIAEASQRRVTRGDEHGKAVPANATKPGRGRPKKTNEKISSYFSKADVEAKAQQGQEKEEVDDSVKTGDIGIQDLKSAKQPALMTGGTMRKYQLEGLEWLSSLHRNGLNGILADEMGLGKTIQTISFLAFLHENQSFGPFLIAAPLSTTSNWVEEFQKWTPSLPCVLYHGSKQDRAEIRSKHFKRPGEATFPIVITSYEICMNDRAFLSKFNWGFIIIDEGHRIKNMDCRLIRELQSYTSANRLLITGTPLQNNLSELWSLLHFLMPQIFDKIESFESWFDFSELKDKQGYHQMLNGERQLQLVTTLHAILKPFLLRRVKADVEKLLPKKREYVLYAPLTPMQRELYQAILDGSSRRYLEGKAFERLNLGSVGSHNSTRSSSVGSKRKLDATTGASTPNKSARTSRESTPAKSARGRRSTRKSYEELSDRKYFAQLEADADASEEELSSGAEEEQSRASTFEMAKKQIAQKKLQNPIMQLRLCCDSPYNFFNPFLLEEDGEPDETIVSTSGKMMILDTLLPALFKDGHKVLIFSQFKMQLDILEQYAYLRGWACCRIDGSVAQADRQAQIKAFNTPATGKNKKSATNLFLLSTRAGGQGINLAAADTVILYDSDWNPQQDLQAQDRAHRIGQTRNVIVYRLATRGTVEQQLLETAEGKRRLEKLVIRKQRFRDDGKVGQDKDNLDDLQRLLRQSDGERIDVEEGQGNVLSAEELNILTDRSDEAYIKTQQGGEESLRFRAVDAMPESSLLDGFKA